MTQNSLNEDVKLCSNFDEFKKKIIFCFFKQTSHQHDV